MAIIFLGLLFWHAANIEDPWAYLWAALALWLTSWSARLFWFTRPLNVRGPQWYVGAETTLAALPGGMTKLSVRTPTDFVWRPGQHVFLRFPKVSMFDNHPFTIVSAPFAGHGRCSTHAPDSQAHTDLEKSSIVNTSITETPPLVFLARCHAGFYSTTA
jgi:predicted ferric reductase